MSPYAHDIHETRIIHVQLAAAWEQGRDYWALHEGEGPNAVQQVCLSSFMSEPEQCIRYLCAAILQ